MRHPLFGAALAGAGPLAPRVKLGERCVKENLPLSAHGSCQKILPDGQEGGGHILTRAIGTFPMD